MGLSHPPPRNPPGVAAGSLRSFARLAAGLAWTLLLVPELVAWVVPCRDRRTRLRRAARITHRWARGVVRASGVRVRVRGPKPPPGALLAANHVTYGDIPVLASIVPTLFLAKREIADWPFIGWIMRRTEHPVTSRLSGRDLIGSIGEVRERLDADVAVCIFLEGTTTAGDRVLKFNAPLVQPAIAAGAPVVPVALRWHSANPKISVRDDIAYWRDDAFAPHIRRFFGLAGIRADVTFCAPVRTAGRTRREIATDARAAIAGTLGLENSPLLPEYEARPRHATADGATGTPAPAPRRSTGT